MKKINVISVSIILLLLIVENAYAFKGLTHSFINKMVIDPDNMPISFPFHLDDYMKNRLGYLRGVHEPSFPDLTLKYFWPSLVSVDAYEVLGNAGEQEDLTPRYLWHFHNPLSNQGYQFYDSALIWAQRPQGDQIRGDYSWKDARNYFYTGLTSTNLNERTDAMKDTFRAVGQLMHLVADMAVPEHTRNDGHPFSPAIELYLENEVAKLLRAGMTTQDIYLNLLGTLRTPVPYDFNRLQTSPSNFALQGAEIPIAHLFDTNQFALSDAPVPDSIVGNTSGLSEYSNMNFISTDTGFTGFNYPRLSSTELRAFDIPDPFDLNQTIKRWYHVKLRDGETNQGAGYKLGVASARYLFFTTSFSDDNAPSPTLDNNVYADYAKLLLPRAVGYASSLMHYFFRGDIKLTLPERGVYGITKPTQGFSDIRLKARNMTPGSEEMSGGSIELVIGYKRALKDPFMGVPVSVTSDFEYVVVQEANATTSIPRDTEIELEFDLAGQEIPLWATDVSLQLIYRGRLGTETLEGLAGEEDAVAVGFVDISEPTIVDYINSMDVVCVNGEILVAGSEEATTALDENGDLVASHTDVYPHEMVNSYLLFSQGANLLLASPDNYDFKVDLLQPGSFARVFVLTEPYGSYNFLSNTMGVNNLDDRDHYWHPSANKYAFYYQGMINQEVFDEENSSIVRYYSSMSDVRGLKTWTALHWTNDDYPEDTSCDVSTSTISLMGPEGIVLQTY